MRQRYDSYKPSGIDWIGEIPSHWECVKTLFSLSMPITDGPHETPTLYDEGIPFISAEAITTGEIRFDHMRGYISQSYYEECCKKYVPQRNDIYMTKSGASTGRVALVETDQIFTIWSPLAVFRANTLTTSYKFLFYVLRSECYQKQVEHGWSFGTQQNIGMRTLEKLKIPFPPLSEQVAIAAWLDEKSREIDLAIAKVDREIELIDELKQSEISRVVTRGLNPDAPLRPSGIDWIGDVPQHWKKCRIKQHYYLKGRIGWQGLKADEFIEEGPFLVTGTDFRNGRVDWSLCYHISEERYDEAPEIHVKVGDILITKDGTVGKLALIEDKPEKVSLNSHLLIIRPTKAYLLNRYLYFVLGSAIFKNYTDHQQSGSIMASLSQEKIGEFCYFLPPLPEQQAIADYLDKKCAEIDGLKEKLIKKRETLKELRQAIISEVVTGKRKVI